MTQEPKWVAALANDVGPGWVVRGPKGTLGYDGEYSEGRFTEAEAKEIAEALNDHPKMKNFIEEVEHCAYKFAWDDESPLEALRVLRRLGADAEDLVAYGDHRVSRRMDELDPPCQHVMQVVYDGTTLVCGLSRSAHSTNVFGHSYESGTVLFG